jgi:flagellar protein FliL
MSNAVAAEVPLPPSRGKKKLILIVAGAVLLLAMAGGGAWLLLKKSAADDDEAAGDEVAQVDPTKGKARSDPKAVPTFVPLESFTVNLADRETERYAQISVTLEVLDDKAAERVKAFLPAVRNNILMVLAHKTSEQLLQREGKAQLAGEIRRETVRALGIDIDAAASPAADAKKKKRKVPKLEPVVLPVTAVHFSNFIVQ